MHRSSLRTVLLLLAAIGCLVSAAGLPGCVADTVVVDGVERPYLLFLPSGTSETPRRVVLFFHGARHDALHATMFAAEARRRDYLLVGLQGMEDVSHYYQNAYGSREPITGWALSADVDHPGHPDLRYFDAVLDRIRSRFLVDENHIHVAGFSNGAFFLHLMGRYRSLRIASVVACSGGLDAAAVSVCGEDETGYCFVDAVTRTWAWLAAMEHKYPVFLLAGDADPLVPPEHALQARDAYVAAGWSETGTPGAPEVRLRLVEGLVHDWPRGWNNSEGYDATPEVFDFMDAHPRMP